MIIDRNQDYSELLASMRLIRTPSIGAKYFSTLITIYGTAEKAVEMVPELAKKAGKTIQLIPISDAEREIEQCRKISAEIIHYNHPDYSYLLKQTTDYPAILTIKGNSKLLKKVNVAIVGSRNCSANGNRFAYKLAGEIGKAGLNVVSGLARGIDTAAHNGSLTTGTIAVVAGGIDHIYPPENNALYHKIAEQGVIVAELPFGTVPKGQNFPQRNRIISGLSYGVAVVEAALASGSLITARMAVSQNREVFAVPGFPLDPRCQGTNGLIKQGAKLIESARDIVEEINEITNLQFNFDAPKPETPPNKDLTIEENELSAIRKEIKKLIGATPISVEQIINMVGCDISLVLTIILELELAGNIDRHPGNKISYIYND